MESIAYARKKTRREIGSFLNHYDFAYVRKDTVNQAAKVAPGIIKGATNKISKIVQQRIDQIISQGGKEIERVLRVILRRAIEDVYQTPFRLLGDFGKKTTEQIKKPNFKIDVTLFCIESNIHKIYIITIVDLSF